MSVIKKTISIEKNLFEQSKLISSNFNALVNDALAFYFKQKHIKNATESFGQWDYRPENSMRIVNKLREKSS